MAMPLLVLALAASAAVPQSLKPGDAAPTLTIGEFLRGEPVASFEAGKCYVVEFWAVW